VGGPDRAATAGSLDGKRIAILATHGFERLQLLEPCRALREAAGAFARVAE
jgi:putative intracellular protease/amidase